MLKACPVSGEGSDLNDLVRAAWRVGLHAYRVTADEQGLRMLPKPLVAYVERDHFICVTGATESATHFLCSDCGPWPGGAIKVSARAWRSMLHGLYLVVCRPGSTADREMQTVRRADGQRPTGAAGEVRSSALPAPLVRLAARSLRGLRLALRRSGFSFGVHVKLYDPIGSPAPCGGKADAQHCPSWVSCPSCQGGPSIFGSLFGDPVNLATGEEEYQPAADLTVYNPIGPPVVISRIYNSLRGGGYPYYENADFGWGWSFNYNMGVYDSGSIMPPGAGAPSVPAGSKYLILPNGARCLITIAGGPPTASNPRIVGSLPAGAPLLIEWDYDSATGSNYYKITGKDRTQMITADLTTSAGINWYPLGQIVDRNGNRIQLQYTSPSSGFPLITQINDSNGLALATFSRNSSGEILSISDRYNRSVYYQQQNIATKNCPPGAAQYHAELTDASEIVATGTPNPPGRYTYGYADVANGVNSEQVPFLTSISVPSPTGTGTSTATIAYTPNTDYVSSVTDANGNSRSYSIVDQTHTKVTITNAQQQLVYSYTVGFDQNMSCCTETDGTNTTIVYSATYSDPNDPYTPSAVQDGNGYAANNGVTGTWKYSHDQYGNLVQETTPYQTVVQYTWSYANFPLGELTKVQDGAKTPTSYTYYEPSGLADTMSTPLPGSASSGQTVTTTYTFSALGNLLTITRPGNNATQSEVTTYNYTQDGGYNQPEALGEALTETNNIGKVRHWRYDQRGNCTEQVDALSNETDAAFNIADQCTSVTYPPPAKQGRAGPTDERQLEFPSGDN